jgi:hypothetical protein
MNAHATDALARLGAADPAKDLPIDEIERARLWQMIAATPAADAPKRARMRLARAQPRLALVPVLVLLSAGPLAAGGVIRFGAGAEPVKSQSLSAPPRGGGLVRGNVHLLPLTAPEPGGAQQWGASPARFVATPGVTLHEITGTKRS